MEKLWREYREFAYALYVVSSSINILHWYSTFIAIDEPTWIHYY